MVPQDTVLFNDTILYNIRYGRRRDERGRRRGGENAPRSIGSSGRCPLAMRPRSGSAAQAFGRREQRVAIARTMLKAPPILVLDEATSALDSFTEREIQSALGARLARTHDDRDRPSPFDRRRADEILVLDKGVIAERGSHQELLARDGIYSAMWSRQRQLDAAQELLRSAGREDDLGTSDGLAAQPAP